MTNHSRAREKRAPVSEPAGVRQVREQMQQATGATCRFCGTALRHTFVDLGMSPLCQTHITPEQLNRMEPFYPLHAYVCEACYLVQLEEYVSPGDIFSDYAYFSSYSASWVEHARRYVEQITARLGLGGDSFVVEIASNDGYLLQHFVRAGIPCLGVEPAANVAAVAEQQGVRSLVKFFGERTGRELAAEFGKPDLILGNNVLAHTPYLRDFVAGLKACLKAGGTVTMEFPHLMRLIEGNQFDTIYHEHFSYFSLFVVEKVFAAYGLRLYDVEELPTHGGSLRIYACHDEDAAQPTRPAVVRLRETELAKGYARLAIYDAFGEQVRETKRKILEFLIACKREGKTVAGYGAPGKGNTLLNYCGIRGDFLDYTVDLSPHKQGRYTPGTHIPILHPDTIRETRPDFVLILPWNLEREIAADHAYIAEWGGRFVVPIPELRVCEPQAA